MAPKSLLMCAGPFAQRGRQWNYFAAALSAGCGSDAMPSSTRRARAEPPTRRETHRQPTAKQGGTSSGKVDELLQPQATFPGDVLTF